MNIPVTVTVLGCRGSIPVCGEQFLRYGGATCCVLVQAPHQALLLDAGTGMLNLSEHLHGERSLPILLTHPHIDHLLGITMNREIANPDFYFDIYSVTRNGLDTKSQIDTLVSPPLWPIAADVLPAHIGFWELTQHFELGGISVDTMEGDHPGGVSVIRLTIGDLKIVYMTDCTITDENRDALLSFSKSCDLLLCDGQYSDDEWQACHDYGHNTWKNAARFALECGAKKARIIHHAPTHSDTILDEACKEVSSICPICSLAHDGEELTL